MDNDLSWKGLLKKGYRIQVKCQDGEWLTFATEVGFYYAKRHNLKIRLNSLRYKHSIQS